MRHIYLILSMLGIGFGTMNGQEQIAVYLKKGTVLKGEMVSYSYGDTLKMLVGVAKKEISLPEDAIEKIKFYGQHLKSAFNEKNWLYTSKLALLPGSTDTGLGISQMVSKKLVRGLFGGVAVGVDNYYLGPGFNVYPVTGSLKYYGSNEIVSPFIEMRTGYGLAFSAERQGQALAKGGLHLNPSMGLRFGSRFLYTELSIGLKFQRLSYLYAFVDHTNDYDVLVRRFEAGLSFTF